MRLLYLHGGPGLNSFAEEQKLNSVLLPYFDAIEFWNEPSQFRDKNLTAKKPHFQRWLSSAEDSFLKLAKNEYSVYLVAHSFGSHAAIYLARKYPSIVSGITLISPALAALETQKRILKIAQRHFEESAQTQAEELRACIANSQTSMDRWIQRGLELAFQDPLLFNAYWETPESMKAWINTLALPESQFDLDSFWEVSKSLNFSHLEFNEPLSIPIQIVFGENDPIVNFSEEKKLIGERFSKVNESFIKNTRHFPHLEAAEYFIDLIISHKGHLN